MRSSGFVYILTVLGIILKGSAHFVFAQKSHDNSWNLMGFKPFDRKLCEESNAIGPGAQKLPQRGF